MFFLFFSRFIFNKIRPRQLFIGVESVHQTANNKGQTKLQIINMLLTTKSKNDNFFSYYFD